MRKATLVLLTTVALLFMAGCGSQSSMNTTTNPSAATAPVGLTVTDTPPDGVTVLFFQLSITGATLTSDSGASVSLLSSSNPIPVNVSQLLTDSAFLGSTDVTAGTYTSLSLTFANPELTIFNASNSSISSSCAIGSVCQLTPATTPLTLTFSSTPFPITVEAGTPLTLKLDIHLNTIIQSDLTVNLAATNGVTLSVLPSSLRLGRLKGTVQSVGTDQFTLQSRWGKTFTILVNSSTVYSFPSSACSADDFSCLAAGQVVKVMVSLQSDGSLLATQVDYIQLASQGSVEGIIIGLSTATDGSTVMDLILQEEPYSSHPAGLGRGHHASVTVPTTGVAYAVDSGSFTIPSGLTFASASDLEVGQDVLVEVPTSVTTSAATGLSTFAQSTPFGRGGVSFTTNSISLEPSQITGTVAAIDAGSLSFSLATLPRFFVPPSATPGGAPPWAPVIITVQTSGDTTFTNFTTSDITGLAVNNVVSVHGWVFSTPSGTTTTTVAADSVLLRPGATPLF
jgi:hypothetical protein